MLFKWYVLFGREGDGLGIEIILVPRNILCTLEKMVYFIIMGNILDMSMRFYYFIILSFITLLICLNVLPVTSRIILTLQTITIELNSSVNFYCIIFVSAIKYIYIYKKK